MFLRLSSVNVLAKEFYQLWDAFDIKYSLKNLKNLYFNVEKYKCIFRCLVFLFKAKLFFTLEYSFTQYST